MPAVSKKQQRYFGYLLSNPEERKKKDQEQANIDARYGGAANRKAGRGLGT